jgi:hypothetical protein
MVRMEQYLDFVLNRAFPAVDVDTPGYHPKAQHRRRRLEEPARGVFRAVRIEATLARPSVTEAFRMPKRP